MEKQFGLQKSSLSSTPTRIMDRICDSRFLSFSGGIPFDWGLHVSDVWGLFEFFRNSSSTSGDAVDIRWNSVEFKREFPFSHSRER